MRKMKKLLSVLVAATMTLAMAATSFADEVATVTTITVEGTGKGFGAYRLLDAEQQETEGGDAVYRYTVNEKYGDILTSILEKGTDGEIIAAISQKTDDDIRAFADAVYREIKDRPLEADETAEGNTFSVPQGYYLIVETEADDGDAVSLVMLDTAGQDGVTVTTKSDKVPTADKIVVEAEKSFAVGDYVQYELTATLPEGYENYTVYQLTFIDEMTAGLTYVDDAEHPTRIGGTTLNGKVDTTSTREGTTLRIHFDDLKRDDSLEADSEIKVTYWAQINEDAVTGANANTLKLEFSNDPYDETGTTTGETIPTDPANAYNFEVVVYKVDVNEAPLTGATFRLTRLNEDTDEDSSAEKTIASAETADGHTFSFTGLKAGRYMLEETVAPNGYNRVDPIYFEIVPTYEDGAISDLTVNVLDEDGEKVIETEPSVTVTGEADGCTISTTVVNATGAELPSTGGIGTTIFYAAGILLMAGAVFFVVRRKRA